MADNGENPSNACVVCYKTAQVYSIGMCEHPVCFECSTRMRVLCQQNECPICRQDLPKVVFTKEIKPFRFLKKGHLHDSKYNIYFDSPDIQKLFYDLLANKCSVCQDKQVFSSFNGLKDHMRRKHDLHFCDLCVDNLKIFSSERRCYNKADLSRHRRKGDTDDKSHRGHPLCEFCDKRYMDNDELYRHLRRDHLFCHFCDADGLHHYYDSYEVLRDHFCKDHYLCEEGNCADEQFTSVFRTEIDLKAHKANVHGKQLGKAAAKQARTLELEFTLAPRGDLRNRRGFQGQVRNHDGNANLSRLAGGHQLDPMASFEPEEINTFVRQPLVDVASTEQFPSLGNAAAAAPLATSSGKGRGNFTIRSTLRKGNYNDNFPALGPEGSAPTGAAATTSAPQQQQQQYQHQPMKTLNFSLTSSSGRGGPAPKQPGASTPNLSIHVNHRPNGTVMTRLTGPSLRMKPSSSSRDADFPALGGRSASDSLDSGIASASHSSSTSASTSSSQSWTKVTCVKPEVMAKAKQPAQPTRNNAFSPPPPLRSGDDFPTLAGKNGPSSRPAAPSWVQVHSSNNSTSDATKGKAKKKKVKQALQQTTNNGNTSSGNESDSKKPSKSDNTSFENKAAAEKSKKESNKAKVTVQPSKTSTVAPTTPVAAATTPRKRSELKIDNLNTTNNNLSSAEAKTPKSVSREEDFPVLGKAPSRPPGLASPPPGFTAPVTTAPPPGFISRVNGLTFTNSSGESYAIVPEEAELRAGASGKYVYMPPSDFQKRNQKLISEFNDYFGGSGDSEQLKAFRYLSGLFRSGMCDADEYYKQCRTVMGAEAFERVFPELLALLPDIEKQRELFRIHRNEANARELKGLEVCSKCGQILRSADLQQHVSSHTLENHFPVLGKSGSSSTTASSASWRRK